MQNTEEKIFFQKKTLDRENHTVKRTKSLLTLVKLYPKNFAKNIHEKSLQLSKTSQKDENMQLQGK